LHARDGGRQILMHKIGGHSKGLQCIRVATRRGHVVLAADATHLYAHIEQGRVFPIVYNVEEVLEGYATVRKLASSERHVVPATTRWCWSAIRRRAPGWKAGSCGSTRSRKGDAITWNGLNGRRSPRLSPHFCIVTS
jgi:glyoxylase-like metal-dependent hydrolase (beta-lactamase superfamily II)